MLSRLPARAKRKYIIFINFQWRREAKIKIFKPSSILKKLQRFGKKYEEIENFETVAGFSIFTETGS